MITLKEVWVIGKEEEVGEWKWGNGNSISVNAYQKN